MHNVYILEASFNDRVSVPFKHFVLLQVTAYPLLLADYLLFGVGDKVSRSSDGHSWCKVEGPEHAK